MNLHWFELSYILPYMQHAGYRFFKRLTDWLPTETFEVQMIAGTLANIINTEPELHWMVASQTFLRISREVNAQEQWLDKARASYPLVCTFLRSIKNRNPICLVFERTLFTKKIPNLHRSWIQQWSNSVNKNYDHCNQTKKNDIREIYRLQDLLRLLCSQISQPRGGLRVDRGRRQ